MTDKRRSLGREYFQQAEVLNNNKNDRFDLYCQDQLGHYNLGIALIRENRSQKAFIALQKALALHSTWWNKPLYRRIQKAIQNLQL
ncbi:MAG: hypothetical protein ACRC2R_02255 [Xenococcaceae cyanobacterium]